MRAHASTTRPVRATRLLAVLALLVACGGEGDGAGREDGDTGGQEPSARTLDDAEVAILGRGIVSTPAPEFGASLTPDGGTLYFNRASEDRRELKIMVAERTGNGWSDPRAAPFSGTHRDLDAFVAPGGDRLWFNSDRPPGPSSAGGFDIWYVERTRGGWGDPVRPGPPLNSDSLEFFVSTTRDGELYFTSSRDGALRVYRATTRDGGWSRPEPVPSDPLESAGNPLVGPEGAFLVVAAAGPDGSTDLFLRCREGAAWGEPFRLPAPVNSPYTDFAPGLDPADGSLLFTSERPGVAEARPDSVRPPGDLYRSSLRPSEVCRSRSPAEDAS